MYGRKRSIILCNEQCKSLVDFARELEEKYGAVDIELLPIIHGVSCYLPAQEAAIMSLSKSDSVKQIEQDIIVSLPPLQPNTNMLRSWWYHSPILTKSTQQTPWNIERVRANLAWGSSRGKDVKVAILDTGIDYKHPDLRGNIAGGVNYIYPRYPYWDDNGHGTHVAGTVAAIDNSFGVVGVAPSVRIYAVKVLNAQGSGSLSGVLSGLQWCVNNKMQVVNMSLGTAESTSSFKTAIKAVDDAGIVIVAAAGNSGPSGSISYPGAYPETICVGATDDKDELASYSSRGPQLTLVAPGSKIYSTTRSSSYGNMSGTSMATPHVAGTAALLLQINQNLKPSEIREILTSSAEKLPGLGEHQQGAGLLKADRACSKLTV
ncbi:MAG: S8 family peptidase [Bacillota bacterium]